MPIAESLLPEFDHEMATTRKCLERMPEDKADWKPHARSFALGPLCAHIAEMLSWGTLALGTTEFDLAPPGQPAYASKPYEGRQATLDAFDRHAAALRHAIQTATDADLTTSWALKRGGQVLFTLPRLAVLRTWVLNHVIHHRGQLSVYLRQLDVPVPSIYGPSADEGGM